MADARRRGLLGALAVAPLAAAWLARPGLRGGGHDDYFLRLQAALRAAGLMRPTLVIDRERLDANLAELRRRLPASMGYRIVAKSLPSLALIDRVAAATGSRRLMVFDQPFLNAVAAERPDWPVLLGKPLPVGAAARFFEHHRGAADGAASIQWLVDTPERLAQYAELARARLAGGAPPMAITLELDIGLHRGGVRDADALGALLRRLQAEPALRFSGFMGYEAHAAKMPGLLGGPEGALRQAMARYRAFVDAARAVLGAAFQPESLTLNAGGSGTYTLYRGDEPCNELAVGSALVMPSDFDRPSLAGHQPACYIATPVLKALARTELPGLEALSGLFRTWDRNSERAFYLSGGYWLADPVSPPGLQRNALWGHSTNQDLLNGSAQVQLAADDHVFFRPHQSERVFLEFGDLAVYAGGRIVEQWPVVPALA
ncbi:MAG TPA: DSD1 family PLP-dependent enzyme [Nevskiaceae bacterium]|nr:DSD1 family PLP-dependent enzyme [Nevskiaceae bacterium]